MDANLNLNYRGAMHTNENTVYSEQSHVRSIEDMKEAEIISKNCNCSVFSLASMAGALLMFLGIIIYAFIAG